MNKRVFLPFLLSFSLTAACLTGCGSLKSDSAKDYARNDGAVETAGAYEEAYYDDSYDFEEPVEEEYSGEAGVAASKGVLTDDPGAEAELEGALDDRKLIKTVNMDVETENFDELVDKVLNRINSLGGYPENTSINGDNYGSTTKRYAYITARIPADKMDVFVEEISGDSNVLSRNESIDDVTLNYVDMEAKKKSLQTEYERLNKLIETADDLETLILLEERLAEVRYELESYESRLRTMDNQVRYSTVNISIHEVVKYTPTPTHEESLLERMGNSFANSCSAMVEGLQELLVIFVALLPFLLLMAVVALIILLIIRVILKKSREKAEKKRREKPVGYDPMTGKPIMKEGASKESKKSDSAVSEARKTEASDKKG